MTKKRCTDCKYTKGIGYDFWCGEGHTEYEVFGAETNCPYYEYHDWSKGTPSRTEKRFTFDEDVNEDDMYEMGVFYDNGKVMETIDVLNCLNNLHEENEQLKQQNKNLLEKLKFTAEQVNYSENLRKMLDGDV